MEDKDKKQTPWFKVAVTVAILAMVIAHYQKSTGESVGNNIPKPTVTSAQAPAPNPSTFTEWIVVTNGYVTHKDIYGYRVVADMGMAPLDTRTDCHRDWVTPAEIIANHGHVELGDYSQWQEWRFHQGVTGMEIAKVKLTCFRTPYHY
ncbi:MAG: hypothetical protein KGI49_00985 [Patescibacteria group bacterium]|nr:hypothetical protein [Patescibacteria group bacterium]